MTTSGARSALTPKTEICDTAAICTITVTRPSDRPGAGVSWAPSLIRRRRRTREDLDEVELAQVRVGRDVHPLVEVDLLRVDPGHRPDGDPGREQRLELARPAARRDDRLALDDAVLARHEVQQQVVRVADGGLHDAVRRPCPRPWPTRREVWSVISVTCATLAGDRRDLADEPVAVDDRLVDADARARAAIDVERLVPDGRRAPDHARGDRVVARSRLAERSSPSMPLSWTFSRTAAWPPIASLRSDRTCLRSWSRWSRAWSVSPNQPARSRNGLERAVGALLDRREHLQHPALERVQAAAGRLAEVGGQEDQRERDEQSEDRPPPADRLLVHVGAVSKSLPRRASSDAGGSSNSCWCGG